MAYFAQNKYKEALADFEKSAGCDNKNFRSVYYMGIVHSVMGNEDKAVEAFTRSLEMNSFQAHAHYRRALSHYNLAEYKQALDDLASAARLGLDNEECKALRSKLNKKFDMM